MESSRTVDNADDAGNAGNAGDAGTSELEPLKAPAKDPHVAGSNSRKKLLFNGVSKLSHIVFKEKEEVQRNNSFAWMC